MKHADWPQNNQFRTQLGSKGQGHRLTLRKMRGKTEEIPDRRKLGCAAGDLLGDPLVKGSKAGAPEKQRAKKERSLTWVPCFKKGVDIEGIGSRAWTG